MEANLSEAWGKASAIAHAYSIGVQESKAALNLLRKVPASCGEALAALVRQDSMLLEVTVPAAAF